MNLKRIIESTDTQAGRAFDLCVQIVIVVALMAFALDTIPDLPLEIRRKLPCFELVIALLFSIEYVLRVWVASDKKSYIFSFFGIVDLLAIAPYFLSFGSDLMAVRALRVLRVVLIFKSARYSLALARFRRAFQLVREELVMFALLTAVVLYISSAGIYFFEHDAQPEAFRSIFHSMWWSVVTLTTVGYGDTFPVTTGGRMFTSVLVLVGVGVVAVPTGLIASALSRARAEESGEL